MIYGIGVDLAEVHRIEEKLTRNESFKHFVFSPAEIAYCDDRKFPAMHYAGRWAVKEAFLKAFGVEFIGNHRFPEIETIHDEHGKPFVQLHGSMAEKFNEKKLGRIYVSTSHTKELATAYVIIEF
jgi:holo-[acyl-carrier protein] synthase